MIPPRKNGLVTFWFSILARAKFKKMFHRMSLTTRSEIPRFESNVPTVVVANHPSWWDALLVNELSASLFKREFFGVFDEEQLRRYAIFRMLGGFAVEKKNGVIEVSEMRRFLQFSTQLLEGRERLFWVFAQGDLVSAEEIFRLKVGFAAVASRLKRVQVLKLNVSYDFWYESKPEIVIDILPLETASGPVGRDEAEALASRVEEELEASRLYVRDLVRRRDRSRLTALWESPAGANPIYDSYRFLKAVLTGQKFDKNHAS